MMSVSVCMFICMRAHLRNYMAYLHQFFCACYLCLWLSPPLACSDTLHISGFMDDIIFVHKLRLLDIAAV